jgi:hypothetical protein
MNIAICYLTNNKNTLEMERRYNLLPSNTDNFIIYDKKENLNYNNNIKTFNFNFNLLDISKTDLPLDNNERTIYRFTYISLLYFYEKYPNYDYYWLIEEDLIFNGDFHLFFNSTESLKEDFIGCYGHFKKDKEINVQHWFTIEPNRIYGNYEHKFPLVGGFIGIQRMSNALIKELHKKAFSDGIFGNAESFPATLAYLNNMKLGFLEKIFKEYYSREYCDWNKRFCLNDLQRLPKNNLIHAVKF